MFVIHLKCWSKFTKDLFHIVLQVVNKDKSQPQYYWSCRLTGTVESVRVTYRTPTIHSNGVRRIESVAVATIFYWSEVYCILVFTCAGMSETTLVNTLWNLFRRCEANGNSARYTETDLSRWIVNDWVRYPTVVKTISKRIFVFRISFLACLFHTFPLSYYIFFVKSFVITERSISFLTLKLHYNKI